MFYFVRIGSLAEIYSATGPPELPIARRVIVRTTRGVELGEIVRPRDRDGEMAAEASILRATSKTDEWLIRRLRRHRRQAVARCREALAASDSKSILLDVDQLFDGGTLALQFLGPVDAIAQSITSTIVKEYESVARTGEFAQLLDTGCGPGCGTGEGTGCGSNCGSCAVAGGCGQTVSSSVADA